MSRATCPTCGAEIKPECLGSKVTLFCNACGWNWAPARQRIQPFQGLSASEDDDAPGATRGVLKEPISFAEILPNRKEATDLFSPLLKVSKPRPIKWSWLAWVEILLALAILTVSVRIVIVIRSDSQRKPGTETELLFLFLTAAFVIGMLLVQEMPRLRLLRAGEIAVGRVVGQRRISQYEGWYSAVVFAFVDQENRPFVGQAVDCSKNLGEGAAVVVFYEALDPNQNTVLEACRSTVQLPTQSDA